MSPAPWWRWRLTSRRALCIPRSARLAGGCRWGFSLSDDCESRARARCARAPGRPWCRRCLGLLDAGGPLGEIGAWAGAVREIRVYRARRGVAGAAPVLAVRFAGRRALAVACEVSFEVLCCAAHALHARARARGAPLRCSAPLGARGPLRAPIGSAWRARLAMIVRPPGLVLVAAAMLAALWAASLLARPSGAVGLDAVAALGACSLLGGGATASYRRRRRLRGADLRAAARRVLRVRGAAPR